MTWDKLHDRINNLYLNDELGIKIPYSHYDFEREVTPPHLMSTEIDSDNFLADNKIYFEKSNARLELTTDTRDRGLEKRIEKEILFSLQKENVNAKYQKLVPNRAVWNESYFFEIY